MMALYERTEPPGADPSVYAGLARSLLSEQTYKFNFEYHTMYPPGLPLVFAGVGLGFGTAYPVRMFTTGAFAFLGLVTAYLVLRRRIGEATALGITLLLATSPYFFSYVTAKPMADMPYFALSFACMYLFDRLWMDSASWRVRALLTAGLAICLPLLVLTRAIGAAMPASLLAFLLLRVLKGERPGVARVFSLLAPVAASFVALILWMQWSASHRPMQLQGEFSQQYTDQLLMKDFRDGEAGKATLGDFGGRILANCQCAGAAFSQLCFRLGDVTPWFWSPLVLLPIVLFSAGLFQSAWRTRGDLTDWYALFYLVIALAWWACNDPLRFLFPVFPLLAFQILRIGVRIPVLVRQQRKRIVPMATCASGIALCGSLASLLLQSAKPGKQQIAAVAFWSLVTLCAAVLVIVQYARHEIVLPAPVPRAWFRRDHVVAGFTVLVVVSFLWQTVSAARVTHRDPRSLLHYPSIHASHWIRGHTPMESVLMADQTAILHYLTGRRTVTPPATTEPRLVRSIIERRRVGFLVVQEDPGYRTPDSRTVLGALRKASYISVNLATSGPGYRIYRLMPTL